MLIELKKKALAASELKIDGRFPSWVKFVTAVDTTKENGYAFVGEFVRDGTVRVDVSKPAILLCQATNGSRANNTQFYQVVVLKEDGTLEKIPELADDGSKRGWALRMQEPMIALLSEIGNTRTQLPPNPLSAFSTEELVAEVNRRQQGG